MCCIAVAMFLHFRVFYGTYLMLTSVCNTGYMLLILNTKSRTSHVLKLTSNRLLQKCKSAWWKNALRVNALFLCPSILVLQCMQFATYNLINFRHKHLLNWKKKQYKLLFLHSNFRGLFTLNSLFQRSTSVGEVFQSGLIFLFLI